jgi:hypothetical protein
MLLAKPPAGGKLFIHHDQLAPIRDPSFDLSGSFAVVLVPQLSRRGAASSIWAVPKAPHQSARHCDMASDEGLRVFEW